jgi:sigma-B regulation protein RsbU (phosphoserine phosphatase)
MPAALYMTVVITLIKAAVQDDDSPAEVMAKINDVLAANSEGGMFVTLFYAVFSHQDSDFIYANAGHAPPYLIHSQDAELIPLGRTGMALGVELGSRVEQGAIRMDPGDFLVAYTDGVTEAASPLGELYGEQRLVDVLMHAIQSPGGQNGEKISPSFLMDVIDQAVTDFSEGCPQADDLSLVVVKRR